MTEDPPAPVPFLLMRRDLAGGLPGPLWPEGVSPVPFDPLRHPPEVHAILAAAYANGGGSVAPYPQWWEALETNAEYDPDLCFVAQDSGGSPVGVAQCWTSAFVKDLAVTGAWRRRGMGEALMLTAFRTFKTRGAEAVRLKVQTNNPSGALRLYRRLGMEVVG